MAKNLANCTPKEFMVQTRLIKHAVEKWLTDTEILKIRQNMPQIPDGMPDEDQRKESLTELLNDQAVWSFFTSLAIAARRLGITAE